MTLTGLTREAADVGCQVGISDEPHSLDIVGHRAFVERFRDLWSGEFMIKPDRELDSKTSLKPKRSGAHWTDKFYCCRGCGSFFRSFSQW